MKSFSNKYMLLYALGLAAVVAVLLTLVATSLKPRQQKNQDAEKKQMILKTIGIETSREEAAELFEKNVRIPQKSNGEDDYYLFNGGVIIPLKGNGLWGPIGGYLALDSTFTVVGAVFTHESETPGLGAEIATDKFAQRFVGKQMASQPIVVKKNADHNSINEVDAISGSTMTCNGVSAMMTAAFEHYSHLRKEVNK